MFKKISIFFAVVIAVFGITISSKTPVFKDYANTYELYLNSSSSMAQIVNVELQDYYVQKNVCGESVTLNAEEFDLDEFFSDFNASVIFTESIQDGINYYAYSPKIKYKKIIKGKRVNLQVVVKEDYVKAGAPLIFGSF